VEDPWETGEVPGVEEVPGAEEVPRTEEVPGAEEIPFVEADRWTADRWTYAISNPSSELPLIKPITL
jgi:hypothetical protein